jgi:hypothetical protein
LPVPGEEDEEDDDDDVKNKGVGMDARNDNIMRRQKGHPDHAPVLPKPTFRAKSIARRYLLAARRGCTFP